MALAAAGLDGTLDAVQDAKRWAMIAPRGVVATRADLAPAAVTSQDRTVQITTGAALVCGVRCTSDSTVSLGLDPNGSGSARFDAVVLVVDWATTAPTLEVRTGTAGGPPPTLTWQPGVRYELLLAIVQVRPNVGALAASDVNDLRLSGGVGGPFQASQGTFLTRVDVQRGATIVIPDPTSPRGYSAGVYRAGAYNDASWTALETRVYDFRPFY